MIGDECKTYKVGKYTVQENGIVRDETMRIVGRLEELKPSREAIAVALDKLLSIYGLPEQSQIDKLNAAIDALKDAKR